MWARTQLKISYLNLLAALVYCLPFYSRNRAVQALQHYWSTGDDIIPLLSVRSGFDLLLQALDLKPGDEIIFSALNVKAMVKIVKKLGLVPIPVDVEIGHMAPRLDLLERAITPRTRVIVVAHLFGTLIDLEPIIKIARKHNILIVEDGAQIFNGRAYGGHRGADVTLFSFGPLKTATALGGGLARVCGPALLARMRKIQSHYPVQPNSNQFMRALKFIGLKAMTSRFFFGLIYRYFALQGKDYEDSIADKVRAVAKAKPTTATDPHKVNAAHRKQPATALLRLMQHRMQKFREGSLQANHEKGEALRRYLGPDVFCPGTKSATRNYWVFPILVSEPRAVIEKLRANGFDGADLPRSQHIAAPKDRQALEPLAARDFMSAVVVIPCYPGMPDRELQRQAELIKTQARDMAPFKPEITP